MSKELAPSETANWKPTALVVGGVLGAAVGLAAAYLLVQNAERKGEKPEMNLGDGVKLGLLVLGLLRSVAALTERE